MCRVTHYGAIYQCTPYSLQSVFDVFQCDVGDDVAGLDIRDILLAYSQLNPHLPRTCTNTYSILVPVADTIGWHGAEDFREDLAVSLCGIVPE